ncbi:MAG: hypothetical protein WCO98_07025 [bacterium]
MEYLFIGIIVVVPWIMGFIYIIKLITAGDKRKRIAQELWELSYTENDPDKKKAYQQAAKCLSDLNYAAPEAGGVTINDGDSSEVKIQVPYVSAFDVSRRTKLSELHNVEPGAATSTPTPQNTELFTSIIPPVPNKKESAADRFKSLQNINILLYLGAFMIVVSAGIFVGFNYQSLTGNFKTIFLTIFALIFYLTGLALYLKSTNIKEAGLTFLTIGLILFPLVGLAYYKFVSHGGGNNIWFITSIVTAFFYALSLKLVKNSYLSYFITFVSLSLFESFISLFDVPIYYFAWGMALSSIIFILVSKANLKDPAFTSSFKMSANYFLPISLIMSLFTIKDGLTGVGVNLLLAGTFYLISNFLTLEKLQKELLFTFTFILFPVGILLILQDKDFSSLSIALVFGVVALLYLIGYEKLKNRLEDKRPMILLTLSSLTPVFMCLLFKINDTGMILTACYAMLINAYCYYRARLPYNMVLSFIAMLFLPKIVLLHLNKDSAELFSLIYLLLSIAIFRFKIFASKLGRNEEIISLVAYIIPVIISAGVVLDSHNFLLAALLFMGNAAFIYWLSYVEDKNICEFFAGVLFYIAIAKFSVYLELQDINVMWAHFIAGLFLYALSRLPGRKSKAFAYLGMVGPLISVFDVVFSHYGAGGIYLMLANLAFAYSLSYLEDKNLFECITVILLYLTGMEFCHFKDFSTINVIWFLIIEGAVLFLWGILPGRRSKIFSYGGMIGPFIGALYGISEHSLVPVFALSVAGAMCLKMSYDENNTIAKYFSYGIFVIALNWLLSYNDIKEMQYYTTSWAVFFGILSYLRHRSGDKGGGDATAILGLAFLTIPTFYQSIFYESKLIYALALGLESIALILVAIGINYKLILRWSITFLIINILYQCRIQILAIPKWLIIGIVGIMILVGATYLLSKRTKEAVEEDGKSEEKLTIDD